MHDTTIEDMQIVDELRKLNMSWQEIAEHFSMKGYNFKADKYRIDYSHYKKWSRVNESVVEKVQKEVMSQRLWTLCDEEKKKHNRVVLAIGDVHEPFSHKNYMKFCIDVAIRWKVTDIVFIGDLTDHHAISRHATEVVADGGLTEFEKTYHNVQEWVKEFPNAYYCLGNHCLIPQRQAASLGLHHGYVKSFSEQWGLPKTWKVADHHIIDNVYYFHGLGIGGVLNSINYAKEVQMSIVLGHKHSASGVRYQASPNNLVFALDVGCGIDKDAYAFNYGKAMVKKPIISCGIVVSDKEAYSIPMGNKYFN